ncbi:MAG: DUF192 domain-containing protein [Gammaproteobacteria bacterium]|nr:DUF192 domain-containing protein [Gammaproteobacteria bacterium]
MLNGTLQIYTQQQQVLAKLSGVNKTESITERTKGLLGKQELLENDGIWITPCNSIHTLGMKYALDIIYINRKGVIKKTVSQMRPRRVSLCLGAHGTIELKSGTIDRIGIKIGDRVEWQQNRS